MARERVLIIGVPRSTATDRLAADIISAAARADKAEPGDRTDVVRYERLLTSLEVAAVDALADAVWEELRPSAGAPELALVGDPSTWPARLDSGVRAVAARYADAGLCPVMVVLAQEEGGAPEAGAPVGVPPPQKRWPSEGTFGRDAVEARFRAQLREAVEAGASTSARAISPSGVQNRVLTDVLRSFVTREGYGPPVHVPVEYRDGSRSSRPFALRSLALRPELPATTDLDLNFSLLSIRHAEMDAAVHGAWLRNAEVSRPRPAGQTDDMVYENSREQLAELTRYGQTIRINLFQTGLETAIVGFYKALTDHLIEAPGTVGVQPMFFSNAPPRREPRSRQSRTGSRTEELRTVALTRSPFVKGTPWTT